MKQGVLIMTLATALLSTACVSSESDAEGREWVSLAESGGEGLFESKCGMCHRANGMGTGILARRMDDERAWLENRDDLAPDFIRNVVRNGFGLMFPMSRGEVSDPQLNEIADYLAQEEQE